MEGEKRLKRSSAVLPTRAQRDYLRLGLGQPGRKLPLFDTDGVEIRREIIKACIAKGWAETWFANPLAPQWLVCRLTDRGVRVLEALEGGGG